MSLTLKVSSQIIFFYSKVLISKTFRVTKNELISPSNESKDYNPDAAVEFNIADKKQDYYCFNKDILSLNHDF
jgi:hypothetical protein